MTSSHLVCHVARVIDNILSFRSRPKFYYTNNRSRVRCLFFFVVAVVFQDSGTVASENQNRHA